MNLFSAQTHKNMTIYLMIIVLSIFHFTACSTTKVLQRQAGMKSHRVKMVDLGSDYSHLVDGEFDYFSTKDKVKKLTNTEPLKQKYRTFRLKKYDDFNKQANLVYARFIFAQKLDEEFKKTLKKSLKVKHKGESRRTIRKAIKNGSVKHLNAVASLEDSHEVLKLTIKLTTELVPEASKLSVMSKEVKSHTVKVVKRAPDKSILTDKVLAESKRTLERLTIVIKDSPKLIKSLKSHLDFTDTIRKAKRKLRKK